VFDKSARSDGTFEREDFTYDRESDVYFCPAGKMLTCKGTLVNDGATRRDARQTHRHEKYHARSTKALAIWRATLRRRMPI
jgi:hypothetical protein